MKKTSKDMQKGKGFVLTLFALTAILMFGVLISALTLDTPSSSDTLSGIVHFNVSLDEGELITGITNCTVSGSSTLTLNSSISTFGFLSNSSENATFFNTTANFTYDWIEDANNYAFTVSCSNLTNSATTSISSVIINNTVPSPATSITPADATIDTDGSITFSGTVVARNTTSCTLVFPNTNPGSRTYTMTHSTNSCSHSLTGISAQTYSGWYITASDETETADSGSQTVSVETSTSSGKAAVFAQQAESVGEDGKTLSIGSGGGDGKVPIWLIVVVVIVIAFVVFRKKK